MQLSGRHTSCPICGGKDRFRFDDLDGRGTWYCNRCGAGNGWTLAKALTGLHGPELSEKVLSMADGSVRQVVPRLSDEDKVEILRRVWTQSHEPLPDGPVLTYLRNRVGVSKVSSDIREHDSLHYEGGLRFPAMVARVVRNGRVVTLHRTYIHDGRKAPVERPKKLMPSLGYLGGAIRLGGFAETMGVAEGIETALAASVMFGMPVWATVSASGLEAFIAPEAARKIVVFADHDVNGVGQHAAYGLMRRLYAQGFDCEVMIPSRPGSDWADELAQRNAVFGKALC